MVFLVILAKQGGGLGPLFWALLISLLYFIPIALVKLFSPLSSVLTVILFEMIRLLAIFFNMRKLNPIAIALSMNFYDFIFPLLIVIASNQVYAPHVGLEESAIVFFVNLNIVITGAIIGYRYLLSAYSGKNIIWELPSAVFLSLLLSSTRTHNAFRNSVPDIYFYPFITLLLTTFALVAVGRSRVIKHD
jgi:hypothetical protein